MADGEWITPAGRVKVEGLRELVSDLREIDRKLVAELRQINKDAAEQVAEVARTLVPQRSGDLLRSINASGAQRTGTVKAGGTVPYAGPIHFGWLRRHILPQPFLYDALDARRDKVYEAYEIQINNLISRVWGSEGGEA